MNWGIELWDQYDNLATHTHKGIEFLDKYGNFVKERCAIELEYAGKLRRLVKSYQPKRKEEDEYQYTSCKAFRQLLQELGDFAGQREVVAENLQSNVVRELHLLAKELREDRKQHLNEGSKQMTVLNSAVGALERARRSYERAARESERALEAFQKADADFHLSRAEVEKQKTNMKLRSQACEDAKQEYMDQLRKTNEAQRQHYEQRLPHVFKQLQDLDEKRIKHIKNFMISSVDVERNVFPIIMQCLDGMEQAAKNINEKEDTQLVVDRYKSGFVPPEDFSCSPAGGPDAPDAAPAPAPAPTVRGTLGAARLKKRGGLLSIFSSNKNNLSVDGKEDYSDLPPNQKKKKLQAKVHELTKQVGQEQAAMEGLMKMKGVYETNPTLGDPMTVEGQLNECCDKLKKLRAQLRKYEELLTEANNQVCVPPLHPTPKTNGAPTQATSIGSNSGSLSRSASESSVSTGTGTTAGTPVGAGGGAGRRARRPRQRPRPRRPRRPGVRLRLLLRARPAAARILQGALCLRSARHGLHHAHGVRRAAAGAGGGRGRRLDARAALAHARGGLRAHHLHHHHAVRRPPLAPAPARHCGTHRCCRTRSSCRSTTIPRHAPPKSILDDVCICLRVTMFVFVNKFKVLTAERYMEYFSSQNIS